MLILTFNLPMFIIENVRSTNAFDDIVNAKQDQSSNFKSLSAVFTVFFKRCDHLLEYLF